MAQDDPVVSAQWLHEHLGMPDVKVKKKVIYLIVHIQFRDTLIMLPSLKKSSEILTSSVPCVSGMWRTPQGGSLSI
jgi:hypothetical protein